MKNKLLAMVVLIGIFFVYGLGRPLAIQAGDSEKLLQPKERSYKVDYEPEVISAEGQHEIDMFLDKLEKTFAMAKEQMTKQETMAVAEFFGEKGTLTGHDRQIYTGWKAVESYLTSISEKARDVEFKIRYVYVKEFPKTGKADVPWHIVGVIFSYSLEINGEKVDPAGGFWGGHVEGCTWRF